jgi:cyclopropane-fatty-acyl-phospholipid synthase
MRLLASFLDRFVQQGELAVVDPRGRRYHFGGRAPGPRATMRLHDWALLWRMPLQPSLALGEGYMDGAVTVEEGTLYDLLALCTANKEATRHHWVGALTQDHLGKLLRAMHQHNPVGHVRRKVAHHYDLVDDLFEAFLDRDMQYSCAYFRSPGMDLDQAQEAKKNHLAAKLLLEEGQRVLDIGSGWGGLALHLARAADVRVVGCTLSQRQQVAARDRARQEGLASRVRFELEDYRRMRGPFDRIVSVGMFEHVGTKHYGEFFRQCWDLLSDDGVMVLHSIGRVGGPGVTDPWLRKYIFPGAYIPALSEVFPAIEGSGFWVTDVEVLRRHYAETIRHWRTRFEAQRARLAALMDERLCRMWEFYLAACECQFRFARLMVFQLQLAKRAEAVPLTRDYIPKLEAELAEVTSRKSEAPHPPASAART